MRTIINIATSFSSEEVDDFKVDKALVAEFATVLFTHWVGSSFHGLSNSFVVKTSLADNLEAVVLSIEILEVDDLEVEVLKSHVVILTEVDKALVAEFATVLYTHYVGSIFHGHSYSFVVHTSLADSLEAVVLCIEVLKVNDNKVLHLYNLILIL